MKKLNNISLLRLLAMLMIFGHHIRQGISNDFDVASSWFPLYLGVEIFLFISGFLYSNKNIENSKEFYINQFIKILVPYYIFVILLGVVYLIIDPSMLTTIEIIKATFILYNFFSNANSIGHFWFIPFILICYLFVPLLSKLTNGKLTYNQKNATKCFIIFLCIIEILLSLIINNRPIFICFFSGYFFGCKKITNNKVNYFLTSFILLVSTTTYALFAKGDVINIGLDGLFVQNICNFLAQASTGFMAISFSLLFIKLFEFTNRKKQPYVTIWSDKYSYFFYIVHQIFLIKALSTLGWTPYLWLDIIIALACTVTASMIIHIVERPISEILIKNLIKKEKL